MNTETIFTKIQKRLNNFGAKIDRQGMLLHKPDLSEHDAIATENRFNLYNFLALLDVYGTLGGLVLSVVFSPESASAFIESGCYLAIPIAALYLTSQGHMDDAQRNVSNSRYAGF